MASGNSRNDSREIFFHVSNFIFLKRSLCYCGISYLSQYFISIRHFFAFTGIFKFNEFGIFIFYRWNAFTDPFDFDTDIYPGCLASAIAREKWSKEYFERVKK